MQASYELIESCNLHSFTQEELANRAAQLRAVQRRLLVRFRDKNPLPLTQLEILFEGTLDQVGECLNFMEENELVMYCLILEDMAISY